MTILKSEVAYPWYPGRFGLSPEYTNVSSEADLREVMADGKVIECLQSLLGGLSNMELVNTESKAGKKQEDTVLQVIKDLDLIHITMSLASTLIMGRSIHEVVWDKRNNQLLPARFITRDVEILRYRWENPKRGIVPYIWVRGEEFELGNRKFVTARYWSIPNSDPYGNGLGEALYPLVRLRQQALIDWGKFSSTYAEPVRVGTYPNNASDAEIAAFNGFIRALGTARGVTLPEGFKVDYIDPPTATTGLQRDLYEVINEDIALLILGENTAGKSQPGNRAKDEVSETLRDIRVKFLGQLVADTLNATLCTWIKELNYPSKPQCKLEFKPKKNDKMEPSAGQVSKKAKASGLPGSTPSGDSKDKPADIKELGRL